MVHFAFIASPVLLIGHICNLTQFLNIFKLRKVRAVPYIIIISIPVAIAGATLLLLRSLQTFLLVSKPGVLHSILLTINSGTVCHIDCVDCPLDSSSGLAIPGGEIGRQFCIWQIPTK